MKSQESRHGAQASMTPASVGAFHSDSMERVPISAKRHAGSTSADGRRHDRERVRVKGIVALCM